MKNFSTIVLILLLLGLTVALGYNYFKRPFASLIPASNQQESSLPSPTPTLSASEQLVATMSSQAKIAQLLAIPLPVGEESEATDSAVLGWIATYHPGWLVLSGDDLSTDAVKSTLEKVSEVEKDQALKPIIAVTHEGGRAQKLKGEGFTQLSAWDELCPLSEIEQKDVFSRSAKELAAVGVNVVFGPVVDIGRSTSFQSWRMCSGYAETFATANTYIQAFASEGIMPVLKHFPGSGQVTTDIRTAPATVELSVEDSAVFHDLLERYPNIGLMTGHVQLKNKLSEWPCSMSRECLKSFPEKYPNILLISDALDKEAAWYQGKNKKPWELSDVAYQALMAGNSVLVLSENEASEESFTKVVTQLAQEYEKSSEFRDTVDKALMKNVQLKNLVE